MTLKKLLDQGKLRRHKTSREEIRNLAAIIERDLKDAGIKELSADRRFATAYNAALQAASMIVYAGGYKTHGTGHHFSAFEAARHIMGREHDGFFDYLDSCRSKRNRTDYDFAGSITETEAEELIKEAGKFSRIVMQLMKEKYKLF